MAAIETFKTFMFFEGFDEGNSYLTDTIWHEGAWWLVAKTFEHTATKERIPDRIVRLTGLRFQETQGEKYRFLLNNAMPKSVFDGVPQEGYVIASYPGLAQMKGGPTSIQ